MKWWAVGLLTIGIGAMAVAGGVTLRAIVASMMGRCFLCGAIARHRHGGQWICGHHMTQIRARRRDDGN